MSEDEKNVNLTDDGASTEDQGEILLDAIANADNSDDGFNPDIEEALGAEHSDQSEEGKTSEGEEKTSDAEVPEDEAGKKEGSESEEGDKKKDEATEEVDDEKVIEEQLRAAEFDILGLKEDEPAEDPVWKDRCSEKDRYITELTQGHQAEMQATQELLSSLGREIINTPEGLQLAPTAEAKDFTADDVDLDAAYSELSDKEKLLFEDVDAKDALKVAARVVGKQFASKVPPVTASPNDKVITPDEMKKTWDGFVDSRMTRSNKPMFPDADKPEVSEMIQKIINQDTPEMNAFRNAAMKDINVLKALYAHGYNTYFRAVQVKSILKAHLKREKQKEAEKNKKEVSVGGLGGGTGAAGQDGTSKPTSSEQLLDAIAGAGTGDSTPFHLSL